MGKAEINAKKLDDNIVMDNRTKKLLAKRKKRASVVTAGSYEAAIEGLTEVDPGPDTDTDVVIVCRLCGVVTVIISSCVLQTLESYHITSYPILVSAIDKQHSHTYTRALSLCLSLHCSTIFHYIHFISAYVVLH